MAHTADAVLRKESHYDAGNMETVDLAKFNASAKERQAVTEQVDRICSQGAGFMFVKNHGVPQDLIDRMYAMAKKFHDLPNTVKAKYIPSQPLPRGYTPPKGEAAAAFGDENGPLPKGTKIPGDHVEIFSMGNPVEETAPGYTPFHAANIFPSEEDCPGFKDLYSEYYRQLHLVFRQLLRVFAVALHLEEEYFIKEGNIDQHMTIFRSHHYYSQAGKTAPKDFHLESKQLRRGPHKDATIVTILHENNKVGGLEVYDNPSKRWIRVERPPDCFVINIGDTMNRWTNSRWMSQFHRVANPPVGVESDRISLIAFCFPHPDTNISPLPTCVSTDNPRKWPDVQFGPWFAARFAALQEQSNDTIVTNMGEVDTGADQFQQDALAKQPSGLYLSLTHLKKQVKT